VDGEVPVARLAGSASLVLVDGATPLRPEPALFDAMIDGWCRQHSARRLSPTITRQRVRVVQRFRAFSGSWPWEWTSAQADAWVAEGAWAHSTVRNYQGSLALFVAYICDPRYRRSQGAVGDRKAKQASTKSPGRTSSLRDVHALEELGAHRPFLRGVFLSSTRAPFSRSAPSVRDREP
jgi:hypothetical protein